MGRIAASVAAVAVVLVLLWPRAQAPATARTAAVSQPLQHIPELLPSPNFECAIGSGRNLFVIPEEPRTPRPPSPDPPITVPPPTNNEERTTNNDPPPSPTFTWKYLGNFGPRHAPIAVFKRDGEIVNAQPGQTVGEFTLNRIGLESVTVSAPRAEQVTVELKP